MISLYKRPRIQKVDRNFHPSYLMDYAKQAEFAEHGYCTLENIISESEIREVQTKFNILQSMEGYEVGDKFESSGNFVSLKTQQFVFQSMKEMMEIIAPRFANLENCEIGDGGAFFIKPNSQKGSVLHPHQDSAVIDETKYYGMFVWVPLIDITMDNGPLYLIPDSHLWGNSSRSQHIPWAFRKHNKLLWKYMQPIMVKAGDAICFDTSIIHASGENYSGNYRIVACGALLPKGHQKIEYLSEGGDIYLYNITDDYWLDGGQKTSLSKYPKVKAQSSFPNPISKRLLYQLLGI